MNGRDILVIGVIVAFVVGFGVSWITKPPSAEGPEGPSDNQGVEREKPEVLKVGYIGYMKGSLASYGIPAHNSLDLIADQLNEEGGILGVPVEIVHMEQTMEASETVEKVQKLIQNHEVDVIVGFPNTAHCLACAPVVEDSETLWLASQVRSPRLTWKDPEDPTEGIWDWVFRVGNSTISHAMQAAYLVDAMPEVERIVQIHPDYAYGHTMNDAFKVAVKELRPDVEIVKELFPALGEADYSPYITEVKRANPDAVFSCMWGSDITRFMDQSKPTGLFKGTGGDAVMIGYQGGFYLAEGRDIPDWILGNHYNVGQQTNSFMRPEYPPHVEFQEDFKEQYGKYPDAAAYSPLSGLFFWKAAIEKAYKMQGGWPTDEEIRTACEGLTMRSPITGLYGSIRAEDHTAIWPTETGLLVEHERLPAGQVPLRILPGQAIEPKPNSWELPYPINKKWTETQ